MSDRERLEAILITAYDPPKTASQRRLFRDMKWLTETLKKYMDAIDNIADIKKRCATVEFEPIGAVTACMAIAQKARLAQG